MEFHETKKGYNMIISFAGHSVVFSVDKVKEIVKEQIRNNIIVNGVNNARAVL